MLRNVKQFFDQHIRTPGQEHGENAEHALQVATAALLFEVMRADRDMKDAERHAVTAAIQSRFELTAEETATLLRLAESEAEQATDYFQFTSLINDHYTPVEKEQVIEHLWQVASADHEIDRFERTLVHKIADLLHVPRTTQIAARQRAMRSAREKTG
jgi:uncharacterized tellurite resistance protein B-like protein